MSVMSRPVQVMAWCALALALLTLALGCGPSPARTRCVEGCQRPHDQCLLAAMTPEAIQRCDYQTRSCISTCPAR